MLPLFEFSFKIVYLLFLLKVADCLNMNFGFKTSDCIEIMQVDRYITWPGQATAYKVCSLVCISKETLNCVRLKQDAIFVLENKNCGSFKVGERKIRELRQSASEQMGER